MKSFGKFIVLEAANHKERASDHDYGKKLAGMEAKYEDKNVAGGFRELMKYHDVASKAHKMAEKILAKSGEKDSKYKMAKKKADAATKEVIDHDAHQELIQDEPRYNDLHRDLKKKKY